MKNILFLLLILTASCSESLKDITKKTEEATFIIYTYDEFGSPNGSGSGFFIDNEGTGITNYHVLDGSVKAVIKESNGMEHEIDRVIASDKNWDIVKFSIKKSDNQRFKYLKFANKKVEKGDVVYNISSPLGLESSVSEGIVSSIRTDKSHGEIIQTTTPISPGSSGSALLNRKGEVFAVATFVRTGGQNLNFGVQIDKDRIVNLDKSDFDKKNNKFNSGTNFIVLNIPSDNSADIVLNAIEFGSSTTTLYLSYTHLNLMGSENYYLWCELNKKENGFFIEDMDTKMEYYVSSSTLGLNKGNATEINLASTVKFKVYFPAIRNDINHINIYGCGKKDRRWQFKNIDLEKYKLKMNVNFEDYTRDYALAYLREGYFNDAQNLLLELVENNPDDVIALNTLGVLSYIADNNNDALNYFTEAIEYNPNEELSYVNRHVVYKYQQNHSAAMEDITKAINIEPDQMDNLVYRASLYMELEDWRNAKNDLDIALSSEDFNKDAGVYYYRVFVNAHLENWKEACKDIYTAFNLTDDEELEKNLQDLWKRCGCR